MDAASLPMTSPSPVAFKSVFGQGREKRWAAFQEIFRKNLQDIYGDDLIANAETRKDLRYRLIVEVKGKKSEQAIGIVIFSSQLSTSYTVVGVRNAFHVKAIHILSYTETL